MAILKLHKEKGWMERKISKALGFPESTVKAILYQEKMKIVGANDLTQKVATALAPIKDDVTRTALAQSAGKRKWTVD